MLSIMFPLSLCLLMIISNFQKNIKQGFKGTISWNKYKSEITKQPQSDNLHHLTDATSGNINRLFVLSFKSGDDGPTRNSFDEYYMSLVEIKGFNPLIDNKLFFDQPVKTCKKCVKNV